MHLYQCRHIGKGKERPGWKGGIAICFRHRFHAQFRNGRFRRVRCRIVNGCFFPGLQLKRLHPIPAYRPTKLLISLFLSFSLLLAPSSSLFHDFGRSPISDGRGAPTKTAVKLYARDGESGREWPSSLLASHCKPRRRFAERYGTTSRSSDYASRRTSFGADRQTVRMGVDCPAISSRFPLGADWWWSAPRAFFINIVHQRYLISDLVERTEISSPPLSFFLMVFSIPQTSLRYRALSNLRTRRITRQIFL